MKGMIDVTQSQGLPAEAPKPSVSSNGMADVGVQAPVPASASAQAGAAAHVAMMAPPTGDEAQRALNAFASEANFKGAYRMANALSASTMVPTQYQNNIPNCLIAIEMASRVGASVLMVMTNLDIIHGRPGWRSQFLIGTVNSSGRFSPIRFRWQGKEGTDEWGCRAVAKDRESGEECVGPLVTIAMAKAEGWYSRNGSKWKTMPELMLMYRSGGFWTRVFAPELSLGMSTSEEIVDTTGTVLSDVTTPAALVPGSPRELEATLLATPVAAEPATQKVQRPKKQEPLSGSDDRQDIE
jgi:hypothetical protein